MTTIRRLVADRLRIPFRRPFPTAIGMWLDRDVWILRLVDDDGRIGLGEAVLEPADGEVADTNLTALIREAAEEASEGRLPAAVGLDRQGAPGRALHAAIDSAIRDLAGPSPGAGRDPEDEWVGVNATIPSLGAAAAAQAAQQSVDAGFRTLKVKAGAERETADLVTRLRAIRSAVGPDVRLRIDVNGAWDAATAEERLDALGPFDLEFVEQPLAADDIDGLARLRRRTRIPIAADEGAASVWHVRQLLAADAVDVLVIKPVRVGGPAAVAEIAELAAERDVPIVISTLFETGIGIAAALAIAETVAADSSPASSSHWPEPLDHGLATAGLLEHDLLATPLLVEEGRMRAPGGARTGGLGIELDVRALPRFRVEAIGSLE